MDESMLRKAAEAHAEAVVKGDREHIVADLAPESAEDMKIVRPQLPSPVTSADVELGEIDGRLGKVVITYANEEKRARLESTWEEQGDGVARVVAARIVP